MVKPVSSLAGFITALAVAFCTVEFELQHQTGYEVIDGVAEHFSADAELLETLRIHEVVAFPIGVEILEFDLVEHGAFDKVLSPEAIIDNRSAAQVAHACRHGSAFVAGRAVVHAVDRIKVPVVNDNHSWTQLRRFQHLSLLRPAPLVLPGWYLQVEKDNGTRSRCCVVSTERCELAGRFGRVQEYLIFRADVDYSCRRKVWSNNTPVGIEESARALTERSANAINLLLCLRVSRSAGRSSARSSARREYFGSECGLMAQASHGNSETAR